MGLMGMVGNENNTFSHLQSEEENQPVSGATSASPGTSVQCISSIGQIIQVAQLSQRNRAAAWVSFGWP